MKLISYIFLAGLFMLNTNCVSAKKQAWKSTINKEGVKTEYTQRQLASHWTQSKRQHAVFSVAYGISTPFDGNHNRERYAKLRELMRHVNPWIVNPKNGDTLVHIAAQYGLVKEIKILKDRGANLNTRNKHGQTPIGTAITTFNYKTTKALLENGACLDTKPIYWTGKLTPVEVLNFRTKGDKPHIKAIKQDIRQMQQEKQQLEVAQQQRKSTQEIEEALLSLKISIQEEQKELQEKQKEFLESQKLKDSIFRLIQSQSWPICS